MARTPIDRLDQRSADEFRREIIRRLEPKGVTYLELATVLPLRTERWVYGVLAEGTELSKARAVEIACRLRARGVLLREIDLERWLRPDDEVPVALVLPGEGERFARLFAAELVLLPGVNRSARNRIAARIAKLLGKYEGFYEKTATGRYLSKRFEDRLRSELGARWRSIFWQMLNAKHVDGDRVETPTVLGLLHGQYKPQFAKSPKAKSPKTRPTNARGKGK